MGVGWKALTRPPKMYQNNVGLSQTAPTEHGHKVRAPIAGTCNRSYSHQAKTDLNKKSGAMHQTLIFFNIDAQGFRLTKNENPPTRVGVTSQPAHGWQIGRHRLAGNSHFPQWRIFIFCFSEPLGINIEEYEGLDSGALYKTFYSNAFGRGVNK